MTQFSLHLVLLYRFDFAHQIKQVVKDKITPAIAY